MKTLLAALALGGSLLAHAQVVIVNDPIAIEQLLLQLVREGDPAMIRQLTGWEALRQSLGNPGVGLTLEQIQQSADGLKALAYDGNGLYHAVTAVIVTPDGASQARPTAEYRKFDALTRASANYLAVHDDTETRRTELRRQIRATTGQIAAATTTAEIDKLKAVLAAQNAELAALDRERDAAATRVAVQEAQNRNDQARQAQARAEDAAAAFQKANENLGRFLSPDTAPVAIPAPPRP